MPLAFQPVETQAEQGVAPTKGLSRWLPLERHQYLEGLYLLVLRLALHGFAGASAHFEHLLQLDQLRFVSGPVPVMRWQVELYQTAQEVGRDGRPAERVARMGEGSARPNNWSECHRARRCYSTNR